MITATYLKAETQAQLHEYLSLIQAPPVVHNEGEEDEWTEPREEAFHVVILGKLPDESQEPDEEGLLPFLEGYHANIYGTLTQEQQDALAPITIEAPETPYMALWV